VQHPQPASNPNHKQNTKNNIPHNLLIVVAKGEGAHTQQQLQKSSKTHKQQTPHQKTTKPQKTKPTTTPTSLKVYICV